MRTAIAVLLGLFLVAPASAGTEAEPDISDDPADSLSPVPGQDIVSFWIEPSLTALSDGSPALDFRLVVAGDYDYQPSFFVAHHRYRVAFVPSTSISGPEAYVNFVPTEGAGPAGAPAAGPNALGCRFAVAPEVGGSADNTLEVGLEATLLDSTHFQCKLPVSLLPGLGGGSTLALQAITLEYVTRGPTNAGDVNGVTILETFDRAPDSGTGPVYVVPELPRDDSGPVVLYNNVTADRVVLEHSFNETTDDVYVYNWTGAPQNVTLSYNATGSGFVHILVLDDARTELYNQTFNGTLLDSATLVGEPGNWTLVVAYAAFTGQLNLTLMEAPIVVPAPPPQVNGPPPPPADVGKKKDSPAFGLAVLALAFVAAVALRRRTR